MIFLFSCENQRLALHLGQDVANVIPWVTVETLLETLLVKVVANEPDAASKNEEAVQRSRRHILISFIPGINKRYEENTEERLKIKFT